MSQFVIATPVSVAYGMWVADLPSAGGLAPLWQVEQMFVTATWVWLKVVGFQVVTLWQLMQLVDATGTWVGFLPVAVVPLWQAVQLVAVVKVLWSGLAAEDQLLVERWQVSQVAVVGR